MQQIAACAQENDGVPYFRYSQPSPLWRRTRRKRAAISAGQLAPLLLLLISLVPLTESAVRTREGKVVAPDRQLSPALTDAEKSVRRGPEVRLEEQRKEGEFDDELPNGGWADALDRTRQRLLYLPWHYSYDFAEHFFFSSAPSTQAHISQHSWERYQRFREETCRNRTDEDLAERVLNSTESAYFHWEESEFHRELRKKVLPETQSGSFRLLMNSPLLDTLDPRLFASEPKSLCKAKRLVSEEDDRLKREKEEKHMFEDFLINKVLDPKLYIVPKPKKVSGAMEAQNSDASTTSPLEFA